jgi:ATP-dependent DNA ligase
MGTGLTAEKMKESIWVKPQVVAEVELSEWTDANHPRHTKLMGSQDDKHRRKVVRET